MTGGPANDNAAPEVIDTAALDAILEPAALVVVDAQLRLQAALVKRYTGKVAAEVPLDSPLRTAAAKAWAVQLRIWFPPDRMLPPWAMALLLPTLAIPAQLAGATQPQAARDVPDAQVVP